MYGFNIIIGAKTNSNCKASIQYKNVIFESNLIDKFAGDKLFFETDKYLVVLDGVILNKKEILENGSWNETFVSLYEKKGESFISTLRGSFAGALFDKINEKLIVFSDQIGSKFIYHSCDEDSFLCSSMMGNMYDLLQVNNKKYDIQENSAISLLTYGYMLEDNTLCNRIKKLLPGDFLVLSKGKLNFHTYYELRKNPNENLTEEDMIEIIDSSFRKAVKLQFEKDCEYGYRHLVALSGGLDSRMTSWVAHDLGYTDQLNFTFSQTDYWDEIIPKQIASDLKHEWIFKSLDNGVWLDSIDRVTKQTGGNVVYYGTAHSDSCLRYINMEEFGLVHSGQLGDVIIGSYIKDKNNIKYTLGEGAYSTKYLKHLDVSLRSFQDQEMGMFIVRGLNGINNGLQNIYNYSESLSPFLDLDFLEKCLSIPLEYRKNHNLYKKWILKKYPDAANYVWESIKCKITEPQISVFGRTVPISQVIPKILCRFKKKRGVDTLKNMNPVGYYLEHNRSLLKNLMSYFIFKKYLKSTRLLEIIEDMEENGDNMEKIQLISLLGAVKMYYGKSL